MALNYSELRTAYKMAKKPLSLGWPGVILVIVTVFLIIMVSGCSYAGEQVDVNRLADAIRIAEGVHTKYPYGILKHYKHTTPRTACINTIKHALRDFTGNPGDFIPFLAARYCPVGSDTDNRTCQYWPENVRYYYDRN